MIPAALALASLCIFIPWLMGKGVNHYIGGDKPLPASVKTKAPPGTPSAQAEPVEAKTLPEIVQDNAPEKSLWVSGYVLKGATLNVQLSDGRILTEKDPPLARLDRNGILLKDGRKIFIGKPPPAPASSTDIPGQATAQAPTKGNQSPKPSAMAVATPSLTSQTVYPTPTAIDAGRHYDPESRTWRLNTPPTLGDSKADHSG